MVWDTVHEGKICYIEMRKKKTNKKTTTTNDLYFKIQFSQNVKWNVHFFYSVQARVSYCPPYFRMPFLKNKVLQQHKRPNYRPLGQDGSLHVDIKKLANNSVIWWKFTW